MIQVDKNIISKNGNDFEYAVMGTKNPANSSRDLVIKQVEETLTE